MRPLLLSLVLGPLAARRRAARSGRLDLAACRRGVITPYRNGDDPYAGGQHRGVDIAGTIRAPVVAAATGEVQFAGTAGSSGVTVSIRTAEKLGHVPTSMSSVAVRKGRAGERGLRIGAVGTTGRRSVERPHLHFGVRASGTRHDYRDPLAFLPPPLSSPRDPMPAPVQVDAPVRVAPKPPRCRCGDRWRHPGHAVPIRRRIRRAVAAGRAQSPGHGGAPAAVPRLPFRGSGCGFRCRSLVPRQGSVPRPKLVPARRATPPWNRGAKPARRAAQHGGGGGGRSAAGGRSCAARRRGLEPPGLVVRGPSRVPRTRCRLGAGLPGLLLAAGILRRRARAGTRRAEAEASRPCSEKPPRGARVTSRSIDRGCPVVPAHLLRERRAPPGHAYHDHCRRCPGSAYAPGRERLLPDQHRRYGEPVAQAAEKLGIAQWATATRSASRAGRPPRRHQRFLHPDHRCRAGQVAEVVRHIHDSSPVCAGHYEGWYCPRCADFKTESETDDHCRSTKIVLEKRKTTGSFGCPPSRATRAPRRSGGFVSPQSPQRGAPSSRGPAGFLAEPTSEVGEWRSLGSLAGRLRLDRRSSQLLHGAVLRASRRGPDGCFWPATRSHT